MNAARPSTRRFRARRYDRLACALHAHAGDPRAIEQQPLGTGACEDRQVRPLADVARQIGHGGGDAVIVDVGDRDREIAVPNAPFWSWRFL